MSRILAEVAESWKDLCQAEQAEVARLQAEKDALLIEREEALTAVIFFTLIIKSGETWSDKCQTVLDAVLRRNGGTGLAALPDEGGEV